MITPSFSPTATERVLPKLALDFTTASLDSRVTFTRTTNATNPASYTNSSGYVTAATDNQPRFDYNPITLVCKGLLIEESRINSCKQSEDFNTTWVKTNVAVATNSINSPANTLTADTITCNAGSAAHEVYATNPYTTATTTAVSVYAKKGTANYLYLNMQCDNSSRYATAVFDLNNGVVGETKAGSTSGTITSSSIEAVANGFYRCTLVGQVTIVSGNTYLAVGIANASTGNSFTAFGEVTFNAAGTENLYLWGAQSEAGAFSTSYIPTTTTALTRNADVATMTGQGVVNQGSFMVDATVVSGKTLLTSGSVTFAATASTAQKTAVAYDATSINKSINAANVTTGAGATASTTINIGPNSDGYFRKMAFYLPKLTNAELQAFSK